MQQSTLSAQGEARRFRGISPIAMRLPASLVLMALLPVLRANDAYAQQRQIEYSDAPVIVCELAAQDGYTIRLAGSEAVFSPPESFARGGTTFEVTYNGFPAEAEAAFQAAVDIWEQHITSPTLIRINANWIPLGTNLLGSAGPFLIRNFDAAPIPNTWYPAPLADAISGADLDPANPDIEATFSSAFPNWYFGTDGNPAPEEYDLTTIVLHEIGHGLGFIGSFRVEGGLGTVGVPSDPGLPFVYDRFAEDGLGRPLLDTATYPLNSTVLADALQSAAYMGGGTVEATHGTSVLLYSPSEWNEGSSYSHLDEEAFPQGNEDGLMTPFLLRAEVVRSPGPIACAIMQDIGWTLAPLCTALVEAPGPTPDLPNGFALSIAGANPFVSETELRISVEQPQAIQIRLLDRLGRVVMQRDLFIQGGDTTTIRHIGAGNLPAGVYFVHIVGDTFSATQALTKLR